MTRTAFIAVAALSLLIGCGPADELEPEDAQVAWGATHRALNDGSGSAKVSGLGSKITWSCPEGGKAVFKHSLADIFTNAFDGSVDFNWNVQFKRCKVDGIVIRGDMDFGISSGVSGDSAFTEWSWVGGLVYTGEMRGSCLIDMRGSAFADSAGAAVAYDGSICGHDASLTLSAGFEEDTEEL